MLFWSLPDMMHFFDSIAGDEEVGCAATAWPETMYGA